uniref:Uncharacterized protein n=1 Tax=Sphaerodactylus townsendi TaxID=933632 RepID=A0ACB8FGW0_9SAUR
MPGAERSCVGPAAAEVTPEPPRRAPGARSAARPSGAPSRGGSRCSSEPLRLLPLQQLLPPPPPPLSRDRPLAPPAPREALALRSPGSPRTQPGAAPARERSLAAPRRCDSGPAARLGPRRARRPLAAAPPERGASPGGRQEVSKLKLN